MKQRTVASRIRNPLPIVKNERKPEITMYSPDLEFGPWYAVETTILVLPIVKHPTFPSVTMLVRFKALLTRLTFATVPLLVGRPCAPLTFRSGLIPPSSAPEGARPIAKV